MIVIKKVAIAGAGTMGFSFAQIFAQHDFEVMVYDIMPEALTRAKDFIRINQEALVAEGEITQAASDAIISKISFSNDVDCFKDADFVIEAIVERMDIKHSFWKQVSEIAKPDAILTTNTSGLSITKISEPVVNPERFCGMHWWNPPHILPLVEIIKGDKTADETIEAVKALTYELDREPVICKKDINGFIGNRLQYAFMREALNIVKSGAASFEDVDKVCKYGLGVRYAFMGPFETVDFTGIDIVSNVSNYMFAELDNSQEGSDIYRQKVEEGKLGIKTGEGFYKYEDGVEVALKNRDVNLINLVKVLGYKK